MAESDSTPRSTLIDARSIGVPHRDQRLETALQAARRIFPNGPAMDSAQSQLIIADEFLDWAPNDSPPRNLLLQCAGFLSLIANGAVPALPNTKREAEELLDKIGAFMAESSPDANS